MNAGRSTKWQRDLVALRESIPEAVHVELSLSSAHGGWRLWVNLRDTRKDFDRIVEKAGGGFGKGSWAMWPHGLSLGRGATPAEAIRSAREHASELTDYLYRHRLVDQPRCPRCEQEIPTPQWERT